MPAFLLPLLAKILPYLAGLVGIVSAYFYVKHKGAEQEREKIQAQQSKVMEAIKASVQKAIEKDKAIDKTVGEKIDALKPKVSTTTDDFKPGDIFKF